MAGALRLVTEGDKSAARVARDRVTKGAEGVAQSAATFSPTSCCVPDSDQPGEATRRDAGRHRCGQVQNAPRPASIVGSASPQAAPQPRARRGIAESAVQARSGELRFTGTHLHMAARRLPDPASRLATRLPATPANRALAASSVQAANLPVGAAALGSKRQICRNWSLVRPDRSASINGLRSLPYAACPPILVPGLPARPHRPLWLVYSETVPCCTLRLTSSLRSSCPDALFRDASRPTLGREFPSSRPFSRGGSFRLR